MIDGKVSSCFAARVRASPVYAIDKGNGRAGSLRAAASGRAWSSVRTATAPPLVLVRGRGSIDDVRSALLPTLSASGVGILAAGTAHNASRILSDASLRVDDAAFGVYLRQRLLLRVTPAGATCACGGDASNAHPLRMLTPAGPREARPADNLAPPVAAIMPGRYCVRT